MKIFSEHFNTVNLLTKVDARVKLLVVIAILAMVISCKGILFPLFIAAGCFIVCLMMRVPPRVILIRIAEPLFIAGLVLLLKLFFTGSEAMFSFNIFGLELTGHRDGLIDGARIAGRIIGGISLIAVMGFSTPFTELMAGLSWFRVPKGFIEIMMFAYRYIFMFFDDAHTIYNSQRNRLGYSSVRKGLRSFGTLTGSLVIRGLDQTQKTAEAMTQRGYTGDLPMLNARPFKVSEVLLAMVFIIVAGSIWMR